MKSKIIMDEVVDNKSRKFGEAMAYFPCMLVGSSGEDHQALFTESELQRAVLRASRNPEDFEPTKSNKSLWDILFS